MRKQKIGFLLILILAVILVSGCQTAQEKPLETDEENQGLTASDRRVLADSLSRSAASVDGVQKATVVISDITLANDSQLMNEADQDTANTDQSISGMIIMVGINVSDEVDEEKTKNAVVNKLKESDDRISQVLVTTDPELVKKINDIAAGIIQGEAISKYESDLKQIGKEFQDNNPAY